MDGANAALKRTALYATHVAAGARVVPFAGYAMPVQYPTGVLAEHQAVRQRVGLFDVGHMGQFRFTGPGALDLLQWVTTHDVSQLAVGAAQYSPALLAIRRAWWTTSLSTGWSRTATLWSSTRRTPTATGVDHRASPGGGAPGSPRPRREPPAHRAHIARFARAARALRRPSGLCAEPGHPTQTIGSCGARSPGVEAIISRTGYTGEYGFELSVPAAPLRRPCGRRSSTQGRRPAWHRAAWERADTLRLEAGMALYGHELTEHTTPLEAGLDRIVRFEKGPFVGSTALAAQAATGVQRRLVGLALTGRGVPREECAILARGPARWPADQRRALADVEARYRHGLRTGRAHCTRHCPGHRDSRSPLSRAQVVPLPFYRSPRRRRRTTT